MSLYAKTIHILESIFLSTGYCLAAGCTVFLLNASPTRHLTNNAQTASGLTTSTPTLTVFLGDFPTSIPSVPPLSTSTPIPAPTQATMASFVGTWVSHMGSFTVQADGHATVEMDGGANDKLLFTDVVQTTAVGKVISSNVGNTGQAVTATLGQNDTVDVSGYNTFCGPNAPLGWCGA